MTKAAEIEIRPEFIYWLGVNMGFFIVLITTLFVTLTFPVGVFWKAFFLIAAFIITTIIIYSYYSILRCTIWIVTEQQIIKKSGVFAKQVDYLELYRIYDYEERKSFIQSLFNNTTIFIHSGDKSTPILKICGIKANTNIVNIIRKRVEIQRKQKQIFELTNR